MKTVLYDYWRSSAAYRIRITLNHLGLEYQQIPVDLASGEQRQPANLARNPQGLVPTLELDDQVLTQSLAIIEYLDETRHAGLLPPTALGRARVRRIAYAIAMEIHAVCNLRVAKFAAENSNGGISMQSWMQAFIPEGLRAVERMLGEPETGRFCHGDRLGMADICLVPQIYNARRWEIPLDDMPNIRRIMANLEQIDAIRRAHPDNHQPQ
ncbi:MAG: maleylacetoacetate isomerase [Rhodobacteraceae bacterium]|nr:maleylacetoacetate isomerase [Paracoccaceae bacterium]